MRVCLLLRRVKRVFPFINVFEGDMNSVVNLENQW